MRIHWALPSLLLCSTQAALAVDDTASCKPSDSCFVIVDCTPDVVTSGDENEKVSSCRCPDVAAAPSSRDLSLREVRIGTWALCPHDLSKSFAELVDSLEPGEYWLR